MSIEQQAAKGPEEIHPCIYCQRAITGVHQGEDITADGKQTYSCNECWQSNFIKRLYRDVTAAEARIAELTAALSQKAEGEAGAAWKLVPIKPTSAMVRVGNLPRGQRLFADQFGKEEIIGFAEVERIYTAMLAAAPAAPLPRSPQGVDRGATRAALELAEGRLVLLLRAELPESDHPIATQYVIDRIRVALALPREQCGAEAKPFAWIVETIDGEWIGTKNKLKAEKWARYCSTVTPVFAYPPLPAKESWEDGQEAMQDVITERQRQVSVEGWTPAHDDLHDSGQMARAAICYADPLNEGRENPPAKWPWDAAFWKPKGRRRDLVRAAALILAEIERLDRALPITKPDSTEGRE